MPLSLFLSLCFYPTPAEFPLLPCPLSPPVPACTRTPHPPPPCTHRHTLTLASTLLLPFWKPKLCVESIEQIYPSALLTTLTDSGTGGRGREEHRQRPDMYVQTQTENSIPCLSHTHSLLERIILMILQPHSNPPPPSLILPPIFSRLPVSQPDTQSSVHPVSRRSLENVCSRRIHGCPWCIHGRRRAK